MVELIGKYTSEALMLFSSIVVVISWIDYIEDKIRGKIEDKVE